MVDFLSSKKTVAFFLYQFSFRGTETAMYNYAFYNEKILKNKSIIIAHKSCIPEQVFSGNKNERVNGIVAGNSSPNKNIVTPSSRFIPDVYKKFVSSFGFIHTISNINDLEYVLNQQHVDVLFILKSGENDNLYSRKVKTIIQCTFTTSYPHGDLYVGVSECVAKGRLYLPHMIDFGQRINLNISTSVSTITSSFSYRKFLGIPDSSIVIGRHGGSDSSNILFVYDSIMKILQKRDDVYFLFAGEIPRIFQEQSKDEDKNSNKFIPSITKEKFDTTSIKENTNEVRTNEVRTNEVRTNEVRTNEVRTNEVRPIKKYEPLHDHIIFISPFVDDFVKIKFINTCDYMIHAFNIGESFGISVLEFDYFNKPIIMYKGNNEIKYTNHFQEIPEKNRILYSDEKELTNIFDKLNKEKVNVCCDTQLQSHDKFSPRHVMKKFDELLGIVMRCSE
jgi:hypothetical protein